MEKAITPNFTNPTKNIKKEKIIISYIPQDGEGDEEGGQLT